MKYSKILPLLIAGMVTFSSCEDLIEKEATDIITTDLALNTQADYEQAAIGVYGRAASGAYYGTNMVFVPEVLADNLRLSPENRGQGVQIHSFTYTSGDGTAESLWEAMYRVIDPANIVLARIESLDAPDAFKNQIRGEMLFLRALAHFDLLRWFAGNYAPNAMGVPLMLTSGIGEPARESQARVYEQIIEDLTTAIPLLTREYPERERATPAAARALLARVSLYMKDYTAAINYATQVIDGSGITLANREVYPKMFSEEEATGEVIFKIAMAPGNARVGEVFYETSTGDIFFSPTDDLVEVLSEYPEDIRLEVSIDNPATESEDVVGKYSGPASQRGLSDIKVIRLSEMYLIRAEAQYELDQEAQALANLNTLRAARVAGFTAGTESGEALLNTIREEWRKEFAFEGFRWFNLKRWELPVTRGADCNATACELEANNYRFVFPIPQAEIFANPNVEQNPRY